MSASDVSQFILDGTKIAWYLDRVKAWERGERIAPITIDMALTQACNYGCGFCYAKLQYNKPMRITKEIMYGFLEDCAGIGVQGISFVSDGESTLSPAYVPSIVRGSSLGLAMASGTHGGNLTHAQIDEILPHLTYLRFNFSGGEPHRYAEIMGVKEEDFHHVCANIRYAVERKRVLGLPVTIGMQMVLRPEDGDQVLPLAKLGRELRPDYLVIKHCSDDETGALGVDYAAYPALYDTLREAEGYSDESYQVVVKWSKITQLGKRPYQRCYGPPFILQISGSGLVAPCGMLFNDKYAHFHIGNICETPFKDIWQSDRYWEVMRELGSDRFDAQKACGSLCLQDRTNVALDEHKRGVRVLEEPVGRPPQHLAFI